MCSVSRVESCVPTKLLLFYLVFTRWQNYILFVGNYGPFINYDIRELCVRHMNTSGPKSMTPPPTIGA